MKCYYEELCVERDANESEIKTAYRKLALKWHPDKNINCIDEAKERFQLIQQAYEVLSDPQERAWYDNHREQILRGKNSNYEDSCLDVFQYFTVSCFKGYEDDSKGFYSVYSEVFEKIATEDAEFMEDEEELVNIPKFGNSKSSYEEVVGPFYAYWSAYCTKRSYTWLCPYDIKEIKDRRILREIEKDMKKVAQKAKKERNEEVRNLVSFIRKRDKRVQAYKKVLEERAAINRQKQEQNRLEQIRRRHQELEEMKQNSQIAIEHNDDYEQQLKQLEQQYSSGEEEYYEDSENEEDEDELVEQDQEEHDSENYGDDDDYINDLYCVACSREFKTKKAFANHETSKKHRDNVEQLKLEMKEEELLYQQDENLEKTEELSENDKSSCKTESSESLPIEVKSKNKKEAKKIKQSIQLSSDEDTNDAENVEELTSQTSKFNLTDNDDKAGNDWKTTNKKPNKKSKSKNKKSYLMEVSSTIKSTKPKFELRMNATTSSSNIEGETSQHICVTCKSKFESKNKLFSHLKLTNHGVYIPKAKTSNDENTKSKKSKGKRK